jgi:hypothetical protein
MIPTRVSFFWCGGPMSWMRWLTVASFRRLNPDWEILVAFSDAGRKKTWTTREVQDCGVYHGKDWSQELERLKVQIKTVDAHRPNLSPAHASDFYQWKYMHEAGGWYSDMDILYVRPMSPILDAAQDADAVFCNSPGNVAIGFMAGTAACPLFGDILAHAERGYRSSAYQCTGFVAVEQCAGVPKVTYEERFGDKVVAALHQKYPSVRITELPYATVYPIEWHEPEKIFSQTTELPTETVGIHWFGGSPFSQRWNNLLTPENFREYQNTFTKYV